MYSGKGDSTTPPDQNGSPIEQTGENSPQTARPTLFAEVFTFEELVIFNGLSDVGKTSISALVNSGHYQPDQLKRALLHIAQTPDSVSPSDVVNGESLASILMGKPDLEEALTETLAHPITQISGVLTHDGRTYVRLTDYLEQVTNSEAGAEAFRSELVGIISQYFSSAKYLACIDPDKEQKVTELHHGISLLVARVARHKTKSVPDL